MSSSSSGSPKGFPNFFKVIMGNTSDTTLIIPPEFMRRFGHHLPNPVFLKLPTGKKLTEVELNHVNGQTLMSRGWPEFKRRLSLGHGHFLLFEFDWNSLLFNVRIFDTSAVEIMTYPILDVVNDYPVKKSENQLSSGNDNNSKGPVSKEASLAYKRAKLFASRDLDPHKTPFFIRVMQKSYVSKRFSLQLPESFGRQSFAGDGANSVTMINTNGRKWSVRCLMRGKRVYVTVGWSGFVKGNRLEVGDVCIFQVAANKRNKHQQPAAVWNVIIFRAS